jgi:hypothetical protein
MSCAARDALIPLAHEVVRLFREHEPARARKRIEPDSASANWNLPSRSVKQ